MKYKTINQSFTKIYIAIALLAMGLVLLSSYKFIQKIKESEIEKISIKHTVNIDEQVDNLSGYLILNNQNAINFYLNELKSKEGLNDIYITQDHQCLNNKFCAQDLLSIAKSIPESELILVKQISNESLISNNISDYIATLFLLFFVFVIITTLLINFILKKSVSESINYIKDLLNGNEETSSDIFKEVVDLAKENENKIRRLEKTKIAQQVIHDIRSPIQALRDLLKESDKSIFESKLIINKCIERISSIAESLSPSVKNHKFYNLKTAVEEIVTEKSINNDVQIKLICNIPEIEVNLSRIEIQRIISNLLNNSIEANATEIIISIIKDSQLIITVNDNGKGVHDSTIDELCKEGFTTKHNNLGFGLTHAYDFLSNHNCNLVSRKQSIGFELKIEIPSRYIKNKSKSVVLIDDDEIVHLSWKRNLYKDNIELLSFYNIYDFLNQSNNIPKDTTIYIDSNLGDTRNGELLAEEISKIGYEKIILTTSNNVTKTPSWISSMQGKECPSL